MSMQRILEPELMEDAEQALAYHQADFSRAHGLRVGLYLQRFPDAQFAGPVLDLGCGSGDILLRFARALPQAHFVGVDGAQAMLDLAQGELRKDAALAGRIELQRAIFPQEAIVDRPYRLIMSHSLLHQLHRPRVLWDTILRHGRPGCRVFVADLVRPASAAAAAAIVQETSANEPEVLRRDFFNSLCAAFEPEEVRKQLRAAGLKGLQLETVQPFHLLIWGSC
ncbi:MAG: methyltransferase domain-containing protein [Steroidobacteraceae bacterium]